MARKMKKLGSTIKQQVLATMEPADVLSLRVRYETWQGQARVADQLAESYRMQAMSLQGKYDLPPQYIVDFETGVVTAAPVTPSLVQETVTASEVAEGTA